MPRRARQLLPDGTFHVCGRGNRGQRIAYDNVDYAYLRDRIGEATALFDLECQVVCLMPNHLHMQAKARRPDLSLAMHRIGTLHAMQFNRRHGLDGHLWQGRFKSRLLEDAEYMIDNAVYLALNPVEAGLVDHPARWPWSSYAATVGRAPVPPFLSLLWLERAFDCSLTAARRAFEELVEAKLRGIHLPRAS